MSAHGRAADPRTVSKLGSSMAHVIDGAKSPDALRVTMRLGEQRIRGR
ncbi:MAG: hypothetical protein U0841_29115 [Chloroflexia bacterium]